MSQRSFSIRLFTALFVLLVVSGQVGCNPDATSGLQSVFLSGQANFPPSVRGSLGEVVPVANAPFNVLDLSRAAGEDVIASGVTDDNGNYAVSIPQASSAAVVVLGEVRVSGLIDTRNGDVSKSFNGITDIACQAGVSAVRDGSITADQLDNTRIANLERAADDLLKGTAVDFTDEDGSRAAAATAIRNSTDNGANAPS